MVSRRSVVGAPHIANSPRWLVVRNQYNDRMEHELLDAGTDLYGAFVKALARHVDDGWQLENFSSNTTLAFCTRGNDRRQICIEACDPTRAMPKQTFTPW
jgi:hypothetical protein